MSLLDRANSYPTLGSALPFNGFVRYKQARSGASGTPMVLLHGIGSGSGSWIEQLCDASLGHVIAWDAPGYADSTPLNISHPQAQDYAHVLWAWLDEMNIRHVHLVGHSLGCIMAAGAARQQAARVASLTLLAPAQGYGVAIEAIRHQKSQERLQAMAELGLQKMAEQRAPRLLSPSASSDHLELAISMMSRLNEGGYTQATHLLSQADIRSDLVQWRQISQAPIQVACGEHDVITPPAACRNLAASIDAPYAQVPGAGHLCALEAAQHVAELLQSMLEKTHG